MDMDTIFINSLSNATDIKYYIYLYVNKPSIMINATYAVLAVFFFELATKHCQELIYKI